MCVCKLLLLSWHAVTGSNSVTSLSACRPVSFIALPSSILAALMWSFLLSCHHSVPSSFVSRVSPRCRQSSVQISAVERRQHRKWVQ